MNLHRMAVGLSHLDQISSPGYRGKMPKRPRGLEDYVAELELAKHDRICLSCWMEIIAEWLDSRKTLSYHCFR